MKKIYSDTSSVRQYHIYQDIIKNLKEGEKAELFVRVKENGYEDVFVNTQYGEIGQLFSENGDEIKQYFANNKYKVEAVVKKIIDKEDRMKAVIVQYDIFEDDQMIAQPQPLQQNAPLQSQQKKSSGCLRAFLIVALLFIILIGFFAIVGTFFNSATEKMNKEATGNDSIAGVEKLEKAQQIKKDSATVARLKSSFKVKKDEFQDYSWVHSKNEPTYRNSNGFFCYFGQDDKGNVSNLRFVGQYAAEDWLFVKKLTFNIDGKNVEYYPQKINTDHNTEIWEWYDDKVEPTTFLLLFAISKAKKVKVRFHGSQYYDDKVLSETSKKNIKNAIEYYVALGGKID